MPLNYHWRIVIWSAMDGTGKKDLEAVSPKNGEKVTKLMRMKVSTWFNWPIHMTSVYKSTPTSGERVEVIGSGGQHINVPVSINHHHNHHHHHDQIKLRGLMSVPFVRIPHDCCAPMVNERNCSVDDGI
jgi:hypothetical protein